MPYLSEGYEPLYVYGAWSWEITEPGQWRIEHKIDSGEWSPLVVVDGLWRSYNNPDPYEAGASVWWRIRGETGLGVPLTEWGVSEVYSVPTP